MSDAVDSRSKGTVWRRVLRVVLALLVLFCCYRLIVDAATAGLSRLYQTSAIIESRVEPADIAVRLKPGDPEAHYTRALTLVNLERIGDAVAELREAILLRPHHYYEWLDLGVTLDRMGDQAGAESSLRESIRLAPSFAQPRWQLGSLLYRQEKFPDAFEQLRLGSASNPQLIQTLIELAWTASDGKVSTLEWMVDPHSSRTDLELANFLAMQNMGEEAARYVLKAGALVDKKDIDLSRVTIDKLLFNRQFEAAHAAWLATHGSPKSSSTNTQGFVNGDFADEIINNDPGFGWQLTSAPNISAAIDPVGPGPDSRSLRIEYSGNSSPGDPVITELLLLQSNKRYEVRFSARTDRLVSGGPPVIVIADVGGEVSKILGQSSPLPPDTNGWTSYSVEFSTEANTRAVSVRLVRLGCNETPCPIFGKLWLAKFALRPI
ncbi:MAG TPA: hypothetical protein DC054_10080 [Blastocatellia bacterium]|nr:hypothetical protein [Blastocatellia bacterium]